MITELQKITLGLLGWKQARRQDISMIRCDYLYNRNAGNRSCYEPIVCIASPYTGNPSLIEAVCETHLEFANTSRLDLRDD